MITAALDTSVGAGLAVAVEGVVVFSGALPAGRYRDADRDLVPWLRQGLEQARVEVRGIERWTVGTGPGSFSGVRGGIALVRGVCAVSGALCRGLPSSLALASVVAAEAGDGEIIGVLHDARCGQVILSRYQRVGGGLAALGPAGVEVPAALAEPRLACRRYVTPHAALLSGVLSEPLRSQVVTATVDARFLLVAPGWEEVLGAPGALPASLEPVYVRPAVFVAPRPPVPG